MNTAEYLWNAARRKPKGVLPILSFPAVSKMGVTVGELVRDAGLQARAMKTVAEELKTVAAVTLMDLSVEAEAFGARIRFADNEVPVITGQLVTDEDDAEALKVPEVGAGRTGTCLEAVRLAKAEITDRPVLAGVIGPYSLAGRLCDVTEIMYLCYDEPETVHAVLDKVTEFLTAYCLAFREAGADGVVLAEPLAGLLSPELADEFSNPYVKRIIDAVQTENFAVIYHNCGSSVAKMPEKIFALGAAGYHFGNAVSMKAMLEAAPKYALCLGNIDPAGELMHGTPESVTEATRKLMAECGEYENFLPSTGCDVPPGAKWENIYAFFKTINLA